MNRRIKLIPKGLPHCYITVKVSKYYGQICLKNFLLYFMSSLKDPIFENSKFVAEIYFIFLKIRPTSNFEFFQ